MTVSAGKLVGTIARDLFMGGKCILLTFKMIQVSIRYYQTYDTIIQFEIWFLLFSACKVLIVAPNMCFIMNINYLFILYALNSFSQTVSNHHLHTKLLSAIYAGYRSLPFTVWLIIRLFFLFCICLWAIYPDFGLSCNPQVYPHQFTALMYMDFLYSVIDIVITLFLPRKLDVIKHQRKIRGSLLGEFHLEDPTDDFLHQ